MGGRRPGPLPPADQLPAGIRSPGEHRARRNASAGPCPITRSRNAEPVSVDFEAKVCRLGGRFSARDPYRTQRQRPRSGNRVLGHPRGSDPGRSARNGTDRPSRGRSVGWSWRAGGVPGRCRRADGLGPEIARAVAAAVWLPGPRGCGRDRGRGRRRASRLIPARVPAPLPGRAASRRRWFRRRALCFGSRASGVSVRSAAVRAGARG